MNHRPIVICALCLIAGYALEIVCGISWLGYASSAGLIAVTIVIYMLRIRLRSVICSMLIVLSAMGIYHGYDSRNVSGLPLTDAASELSGRDSEVSGSIDSAVVIDGDRVKCTIRADHISIEGNEPILVNEQVLATIRLAAQTEQAIAGNWKRGDRVVVRGTLTLPSPARNFGGFDYQHYLYLKHIHWTVSAKGIDSAEIQPQPFRFHAAQMLRLNDDLRKHLGDRISRMYAKDQVWFMKSLLIGDREELNQDQFQQFSELGLSHILAISGLHVGVFIAIIIWLLKRFRFTRETYLLAAICLLPLYIMITGASPSVLRAGIMAMIGLYAARRRILKDSLHLIAIAAIVLLLWDPYYLYDLSFQLSFIVTTGLIIGVPRISKLLPIAKRWLNSTVSITIVSQLVTFPLTIYYFNQYSLLSWLANAMLVPVFSMLVFPAGLASLIASFFYTPAGEWIGVIPTTLNRGAFQLIEWMDRWKSMLTIWPSPSVVWIVSYYVALILIYRFVERTFFSALQTMNPGMVVANIKRTRNLDINPRVGLIAATVALCCLLFVQYTPDRFNRDGYVEFIDVGQGDSILIRTPAGKHILIDGGGTLDFGIPGDRWRARNKPYEVGRNVLVPLLKKRGIHRIDMIILTHQHKDHFGGLQAVVDQLPVGELIFNGTMVPNPDAIKLFRTVMNKHIRLEAANFGESLQLDSSTSIHFLYPIRGDNSDITMQSQQNNNSVAFILEMSGTRWLLTGDMEKPSEEAVLDQIHSSNIALFEKPIDVLKVAHHGSKTSTSEDWLAAFRPKAAVISVGERNSYGHPSPQVLERLLSDGVIVYRTDLMGEVQMTVHDGKIYTRTKLLSNIR